MAFIRGVLTQRRIRYRLVLFAGTVGMVLSLTAGCASRPPMESLAPKPGPDHGFPGVSVSGGQSQWPPAHAPEEEEGHRIYSQTSPSPPAPVQPTKAPAEVPVHPPAKHTSSSLQRTVYFSFNSAQLTYWDAVVLDRLINALKHTRYQRLILHGSTDPLGSETYNKKLGLKRSLSVKRYLVKRGIPAKKIHAVSWGDRESKHFSACRRKSPLCHSQSRSVRIEIIRETKSAAP